jgi:hypothetical protein
MTTDRFMSDFSRTGYEACTHDGVRVYDFPREIGLSILTKEIQPEGPGLEGVLAVAGINNEKDHGRFLDMASFAKKNLRIPDYMLLVSAGYNFGGKEAKKAEKNFAKNIDKIGIRAPKDYIDIFNEPHSDNNIALLIIRADDDAEELEVGLLGFFNILKYDMERNKILERGPDFKLNFDSLMNDISFHSGRKYYSVASIAGKYFV